MPIISPTAISPHNRRGGISFSSYWATLISATVENAAPTHVVLTFPTAQPSLVASDFTIAGFTVSSGSWSGAVLTLVLSEAVIVFDGNLTITFGKTSETATVTNNVADDGNTLEYFDPLDISTVTKDESNVMTALAGKLGFATLAGSCGWSATEGATFNGSDQYLDASFTYNTNPRYIYLLINSKGWTSGDTIHDGAAVNTLKIIQGSAIAGSPNIQAYLAGSYSDSNPNATLNEWHIIRLFITAADDLLQVDELDATTGDWGGGFGAAGITWGASGNITANWYGSIKYAIYRSNIALQTEIINSLKKKIDLITNALHTEDLEYYITTEDTNYYIKDTE